MFSRPLAFILLALGCVTAAAGGAYVATRHNNVSEGVAVSQPAATPAQGVAPAPASQPVAETEAAVTDAKVTAKKDESAPRGVKAEAEPAPAPSPRRSEPPASKGPAPARQAANTPRTDTAGRTTPSNGAAHPQPEAQAAPVPALPDPAAAAAGAPKAAVEPPKPYEPQPEPARVPQFEEVILPASSVIGLQLETPLSSERAHVEDRVEARVSRDVMAAGRVAIPAGSRLLGTVIEVDKGGKVKTAAQIGIRFHTLVLADGNQVSIRTEPISRSAESPAANSAKKIGGAAILGGILGGIMGGGKGAAIGAATGAGGGTAAVMTGDRAAVNVPAGTFMNATLASPATITVERRE